MSGKFYNSFVILCSHLMLQTLLRQFISNTFSFHLSFSFMIQHSDPYITVEIITAESNLVFNYREIFLSFHILRNFLSPSFPYSYIFKDYHPSSIYGFCNLHVLHRCINHFSTSGPHRPTTNISLLTPSLPVASSLHIYRWLSLISSSSTSGVYSSLVCLCMYGKFWILNSSS